MRNLMLVLIALSACQAVFAQSPYSGLQDRAIKALSSERIAGLEAGRGLGYAMAAELNGYPGPMHVLELAEALELSDEQVAQTSALFEAMRERAIALGRELIAAEAALDKAFAEREITPGRLGELVAASARIEGELRRVHLEAHLDQTELLDEAQTAEYMRLRGYAEADGGRSHRRHRH